MLEGRDHSHTGETTGPSPAAQGELPPAALALCRLLAEAWGEEVWRAALAEVEREAGQGVASKDVETD